MPETLYKMNALRIRDLDKPIYRHFSFPRLIQLLETQHLALVTPSSWDDPYEQIGSAVQVYYKQGGRHQQKIHQPKLPIYAQCWTSRNDCDTLLRAYSQVRLDPVFNRNVLIDLEGVMLETTPRKLLAAVEKQANSENGIAGDVYIGAVHYLDLAAFHRFIGQGYAQDPVNGSYFENPWNRAELLLKKRLDFQSENEVRIMHICREEQGGKKVLQIPVDVNHLISRMFVDPRLGPQDRRDREQAFAARGYTGPVEWDSRYQRTILSLDTGVELP